VKNIPRRRSLEEIRALFSPHGRVLDIKEHPIRAEVRYVFMDPVGAQKAITALNGKVIDRKALFVEVSHEVSCV